MITETVTDSSARAPLPPVSLAIAAGITSTYLTQPKVRQEVLRVLGEHGRRFTNHCTVTKCICGAVVSPDSKAIWARHIFGELLDAIAALASQEVTL